MAKIQRNMDVDLSRFAGVMAGYRELAGITQKDAAREVGVRPEQFSRYENGASAPIVTTLAAIARLYGLTDAQLGGLVRLAAGEDEAP